MSGENNSIGSKIGSALLFPMMFTAPEVISVAKRNGGLTKSKMADEMKLFRDFIQNSPKADTKDVFSRGIELSNNYEVYKSACKRAQKAQKALDKGVKLPFREKLLNHFRKLLNKQEVTQATIKAQKEQIVQNFNTLKTDMANGVNVARNMAQEQAVEDGVEKAVKKVLKKAPKEATKEELENTVKIVKEKALPKVKNKVAKNFAKANASTLAKAGNMFKKEITSPIVLLFTALEAIPEFKEKVIPAFKNEGFKEGVRQTGLSLFKMGTNLLSFATGSTLGKLAGMALGALIAPEMAFVAAIGGTLGSILGISATNKISEKIVQKVENKSQQKKQRKSINVKA